MRDTDKPCYDGAMEKPPSRREARTEAILRATIEELAERGYAALSFESVAGRVGIAKTTLYRRYPTKEFLVRAAIERYVDSIAGEALDTGSVRGDLLAVAQKAIAVASSAIGKGLLKLGLERPESELFALSKDFEARKAARDAKMAERAVARGEIADAAQLNRLADVLTDSILFKVAVKREAVDEVEIGRLVDLLMNGVSKPVALTDRRKPAAGSVR